MLIENIETLFIFCILVVRDKLELKDIERIHVVNRNFLGFKIVVVV